MLNAAYNILLMLIEPTLSTLYMVAGATVFSLILGFPLGILLCVTSAGNLIPQILFNKILEKITNILRSFPFIILMIIVFPLSRFIVGTSIGTAAAIVPLSIAAMPFVARIIKSALKEVNPEIIQAAKVMGSSNRQIIFKVMLPEAYPALIAGITLTIINIIGYAAMAGSMGGGGLGDLAIRYGYQRFRLDVMIGAVLVIIIMVEFVQFLGDKMVHTIMKRRGLEIK